ncbi:hypothetical protein D5R81_17340 [Parashewanella spongiae]|uniref:Uncharacterized protein n=1 Tax=Parashewanella spongiae TaxID=342950 RepID=A0A3A6TGY5_9GAMM|nr:hypothetical protein [Parashewanella spongiae]MCL1077620.1 hypothetical protein [Parashewanella spongiae]RJY06783.1 hypothetical protein D5R81_17340 [Parashewanella spongiae]
MKSIFNLKSLLLLFFTIATPFAYAANPCLGDPGTPLKKGSGTVDDPYQLVLGYDLCDITLVKSESADDHNFSYADDTIYYQYNFENIPYKKDGKVYENGFVVSLAMNELSSVTINPVKSSPIAACAMAYDEGAAKSANYQYNYYDGGCAFRKQENSARTFSGNIKFSISIKDDQEIKRVVDENGNLKYGPHGGRLGSGVIGINWVKPPVYSPFSLEH